MSEHLPLSANESFIWAAYAKVNRQTLGQSETHRLFGEIGQPIWQYLIRPGGLAACQDGLFVGSG
jgi:hypothetical protein